MHPLPPGWPSAGILSEASNRELREAARAAWVQQANGTPGVVAQFLVFGAGNDTAAAEAVQQEADALGDILLLDQDPPDG